jgi:hypothetical protein
MRPAQFLVQTHDGNIHTYWSLDILLIDLSFNRHDSVRLYRIEDGIMPKYVPTTEDALRELRRSA